MDRDIKITVELKNGLKITGKLTFVDNNMNFNLSNIEVDDDEKTPQFVIFKQHFKKKGIF